MDESRRERFAGHLREAWWADVIIGAIIVSVGIFIVKPGSAFDILGPLSPDHRKDAYASLLTIVTFFAGFTSLAFAAYLGFKSESMALLNKRVGRRIKQMWGGMIALTWLSAVAVWVASIFDARDKAVDVWPRWLAIAALSVMFIQLARVMWLLFTLHGVSEVQIEPARPTAATPIRLARRQQLVTTDKSERRQPSA